MAAIVTLVSLFILTPLSLAMAIAKDSDIAKIITYHCDCHLSRHILDGVRTVYRKQLRFRFCGNVRVRYDHRGTLYPGRHH